ncbi:MAG TPA: cyclic nucleotide-binding domain-containing protein [Actinomycetes bacterium]|nr:cyclic nucleotide-binding domain-containing protein [Actinomycetes bacterium]
MIELTRLAQLAFLRGLPRPALVRLAEAAEEQELEPGRVVLRQYDHARSAWLLCSGAVQVLIRVGGEDLLVAVLRDQGELIGWSALRPPYRYTASIRCEERTRLVRVPAEALAELFERDPALEQLVLRRVAAAVADRLERARGALRGPPGPAAAPAPGTPARGRGGGAVTTPAAGAAGLLERSPFFEGFAPDDLAALAAAARVVPFGAGERVFAEGEPATTLYLLVAGAVRLAFTPPAGEAPPDGPVERRGGGLPLQLVGHAGYPIGWSALVEPYAYRATATATRPTRLLALDRACLEERSRARPAFGVALARAVLGLVGDRLRATRLRLVARRYDDHVLAIRDLLEQSGTQLSVASPLHKLPHYLQNRLTVADAFHTLDQVELHGDPVERHLASLCADSLRGVRRELWLYQQLQAIYEIVAGAPPGTAPEDLRRDCALAFQRLFAGTRHRILGTGRLPPRPGHVFVMNHLSNHPDNLLPNNFILTLDTHFVSSMILLARYGEAPIRVIRRSRPDEHGHQRFYDRLGYVYASPGSAAGADGRDPPGTPEARHRHLLDAAGAHLAAGRNVVICPEGSCTSTERSPLRMRPGAFRLAAHVRPEPLIVPVAVANFDKRLMRTTTVAVVHEPFRLSDHVPDAGDARALLDFVNGEVGRWFRGWVRDAAAVAEADGGPDR